MNLNMKNNKGITMIALVLTIVVSLMLVGITINEFDDDDEIIEKSLSTKDQNEISRVIEKAKLEIMEHNVEMLEQSKDRSLTSEQMKEMLEGKSYVKEVDGYYVVTKSGHKIPMTDIYDNISDIPEDYFTNWVSVKEVFDANGKDKNAEGYNVAKMHIGDFVKYDAGEWTTTEIKAIKVGKTGKEVVANNSTDIPSEEFQFGGFGVGTDRASRNGNAKTELGPYSYIKDTDGNEVSGWRVFDVADDGTITLISAGCPEDYFYDYDISNGQYINEYILSGNINTNTTITNMETTYTKRNWDVYVNEKQGAVGATVLTKTKLDEWYNKYMGYENADTYTNDIFRTIYGTRYESIIDNYSYYWFCYVRGSGSWSSMCWMDPNMELMNGGGSGRSRGIRILVTLSPEAKVSDKKTDTRTIVDPRNSSNRWNYNVWSLKSN